MRLLDLGAEPDARDASGTTALSIAASMGHASVIPALVQHGASLEATDSIGQTPLLTAAASGQLEAVETLVALGAELNSADNQGVTPLIECSRSASLSLGFETASVLLDATSPVELDRTATSGYTALSMAASLGNAALVSALLRAGAEVNLLAPDGSSALMSAAENGSLPIVRALLESGANASVSRNDGLTAVMAACGQYLPEQDLILELTETLLEAGADGSATDARGVNACHMAAEVGSVPVVRALASAGADCTQMAKGAAITPLIVASAAGTLAVVEYLISITPKEELDVMHTDKSAMSALMAAASNGSIAITTTLLDAGADINLRNSDGVTALMHASVLGHVSLVEFLLDSGADLQATDHDGFDALVAAATGGNAEVASLLLGQGLDVNVMAGSGGAPLMIAAKAGATDCVQVLLDANAEVNTRARPSAAFVAEIDALQIEVEAVTAEPLSDDAGLVLGLTEAEVESKRQRIEAFFEEGSTALMHAASLGHHDVVRLLLRAGADVSFEDLDGQTALVHAATIGSVQGVQMLLEIGGADPNAPTASGIPVLMHVIGADRASISADRTEAMATALLKHGADPNAGVADTTPLLLAAQGATNKLLQYLLYKGADPNVATEGGITPLMLLAASGNSRGVKLVLDTIQAKPGLAPLNVDATTQNGTSALHTASQQAHLKVVSQLLSAGASTSVRDMTGATPLGNAYDGLQNVATFVEENLARLGGAAADRSFANDMLYRAGKAHVDTMEALLLAGAEPSLIDKKGDTVNAQAAVEIYRRMFASSSGEEGELSWKEEL